MTVQVQINGETAAEVMADIYTMAGVPPMVVGYHGAPVRLDPATTGVEEIEDRVVGKMPELAAGYGGAPTVEKEKRTRKSGKAQAEPTQATTASATTVAPPAATDASSSASGAVSAETRVEMAAPAPSPFAPPPVAGSAPVEGTLAKGTPPVHDEPSVRAKLMELREKADKAGKDGMAEAFGVLQAFGHKTVKDMKPAEYDAIYTKAEAALAVYT